MQLLLLAAGLDDIPRKTIDVDPAALCPLWLWRLQEVDEPLVAKVVHHHVPNAEIHNGNLACGVQHRHACVSTIRLVRVVARLRAGLPAWPRAVKVIVVLDRLEGIRPRRPSSENGRCLQLGIGTTQPQGRVGRTNV
jgi:hypothetical protein